MPMKPSLLEATPPFAIVRVFPPPLPVLTPSSSTPALKTDPFPVIKIVLLAPPIELGKPLAIPPVNNAPPFVTTTELPKFWSSNPMVRPFSLEPLLQIEPDPVITTQLLLPYELAPAAPPTALPPVLTTTAPLLIIIELLLPEL